MSPHDASRRRTEAQEATWGPLDFDQLSMATLANLRALAAYLGVALPSDVTHRLAAQMLARALKRGAKRKLP